MTQALLLDCTLRDGGFINNWEFGKNAIHGIFSHLLAANVDIIEIGFINAACSFCKDRSMLPHTKHARELLGAPSKGKALVVGMIDYGTCPTENIEAAVDSYLDGIRVIFKKQAMHKALAFCHTLKALGYLVFVQPVSITDYTKSELQVLFSLANDLAPHAISVVDTYGLLSPHEAQSYFSQFDQTLAGEIAIGYHAHNNLQQGFAACRAIGELAAKVSPTRQLIFDGALFGMGKSAGNTPLELLALWQNETEKRYDLAVLLAAIEDFLPQPAKSAAWGYQLPYFTAAATRTHPSYVLFLQKEMGLSISEIYRLLQELPNDKRLSFCQDTAKRLCRTHSKEKAVLLR